MIRLDEVTYRYEPSRAAVDGISLDIAAGECFGLIGSNGAGKTTTIRILATLLLPDSGRVTVAGFDAIADYRKVRRALGYMPESFTVYQELTVDESQIGATGGQPADDHLDVVTDQDHDGPAPVAGVHQRTSSPRSSSG